MAWHPPAVWAKPQLLIQDVLILWIPAREIGDHIQRQALPGHRIRNRHAHNDPAMHAIVQRDLQQRAQMRNSPSLRGR